jgi:hypothetical protein
MGGGMRSGVEHSHNSQHDRLYPRENCDRIPPSRPLVGGDRHPEEKGAIAIELWMRSPL